MKKLVLLAMLLPLAWGGLQAQTQDSLFSDPGFDYWESGEGQDGVTYDDLMDPFWGSLNELATLPPDMFTGPVTLFKDAGRSGEAEDFAPRMESSSMVFGGEGMELFIPGVVGTIDVDFANIDATLGYPFTSRPLGMKGYMKYAPVNGDSASIFVELKRYNEDLGMSQMIGRGELIFKEAVADWTEFDLTIEYKSQVQPDSITVLFVASAGYNFDNFLACQGQKGSSLWVDDVQLYYEEATPEPDPSANENAALAASRLYPNPSADGRFNLQLSEACRVQVLSVTGQLLQDQEMAAGVQALDLSKYAPAYYVVRLSNEKGSAALKAVVR
ncbi:MAG: PCMD domain-containing protein [Bacteroidetes bacterium]|uniref:PCMD domain-containing protein n=1 Tax=Candidatus Pullibacteroides excrementavium TaxID=2840905 RepID=A0A9D9DQF2_9BACT|nr:PCMD domain-containing protein [Candidatus Pullibacteroides excrementavium]